jgi:hypothetical protein
MVKNLNEIDVALCLYALEDIERENQKQDVLLRDRVMTRDEINTYLKKTKRKEENLRAIARPTAWPSHITFRSSQRQLETPPISRGHHGVGQGLSPSQLPELATPSWTTTPSWNVSASPSKLLTPRSSLSQRTSCSSIHIIRADVGYTAEEDGMLMEYGHIARPDTDESMGDLDSCEDDEVSAGDMARICAGLAASDDFGAMVRQTVAPKPLSTFERADPLFFTLLSPSAPAIYQQDQQEGSAAKPQAYESMLPFIKPDRGTFATPGPTQIATQAGRESTVPTEPSVSFLRECLSACIVHGQGFREAATVLMHGAVQVFSGMIRRRDPYCLTALNLLTAVLESVGQRLLAETVLRKILETANVYSENEGPVNATIRFMLEIVSGRAKKSEYNANRMWQVYHELCELWGADSPSALTGLYHVAWTLALVQDTRGEAWAILEPLNFKCELTLGPCHFQTITTMTTSARVLYHLGDHWKAALMINRAIQRLDLMYEDFHPFCLEARSRQATLLMKLEGSHDVETILQDVLRQQVLILGFDNPRTQSTLATLQRYLNGKGRSQEAFILPEILGKSQQQ